MEWWWTGLHWYWGFADQDSAAACTDTTVARWRHRDRRQWEIGAGCPSTVLARHWANLFFRVDRWTGRCVCFSSVAKTPWHCSSWFSVNDVIYAWTQHRRHRWCALSSFSTARCTDTFIHHRLADLMVYQHHMVRELWSLLPTGDAASVDCQQPVGHVSQLTTVVQHSSTTDNE